ncbi:efflux RND transporter periplasmic adaptor subunit [Paenibacillus sp. SYP-B3998]|uniref:Efflux RND transporter periplasmic adaptor subunit n=1 Tax=Paenibacillus sp. SYP-B3998 TaxID=2678564 RepID=A0A6G4A3J6_9BACL|nr:efflux RND transporter periplasmic adaptor subunit [Paenibacillus sp. SYP-B3998]NEW09043.1 efflux RND transporter periplasmic adaptor subunit [Paenibacillus sp. SYP-B3998]
MELQLEETVESRKKRKIKMIAGIFFGLLITLTLFSNTLQSITLPKVRIEKPVQGSLNHNIQGSGVLKPLDEAELKSDIGWKVKTIHVKNGDIVVKGQVLLTYESKAAERQILDEKTAHEQQKLQLEGLFAGYVEASKGGDYALISRSKRDVESLKLEMSVRERKIQALQEDLQINRQIIAPFDGIITKLNATEGLSSDVGSTVVRLSNHNKGFSLSLLLTSEQAALLHVGEKIEVEVKDPAVRVVEGEIAEIQDTESTQTGSGANQNNVVVSKSVRITVQDEALRGAERAEVRVKKSSSKEDVILVSNAAIHRDRGGEFVYVIEERKGPLGNVFRVRKTYIQIVDASENETAVQQGIFLLDEVIIESSEPLQEGNRVRLQ